MFLFRNKDDVFLQRNPQLLSRLLRLEIDIRRFPAEMTRTQSPCEWEPPPDRISSFIPQVRPIQHNNSCEPTQPRATTITMSLSRAAWVSKTTLATKGLYQPTGLRNVLWFARSADSSRARAAVWGQLLGRSCTERQGKKEKEWCRLKACCTHRHMAPCCKDLKLKMSTLIRPQAGVLWDIHTYNP